MLNKINQFGGRYLNSQFRTWLRTNSWLFYRKVKVKIFRSDMELQMEHQFQCWLLRQGTKIIKTRIHEYLDEYNFYSNKSLRIAIMLLKIVQEMSRQTFRITSYCFKSICSGHQLVTFLNYDLFRNLKILFKEWFIAFPKNFTFHIDNWQVIVKTFALVDLRRLW